MFAWSTIPGIGWNGISTSYSGYVFFFLVLRFGFLRLFGFRSVFDVIESLALSRSTAFLSTRRLLLQTREA